MEKQIYESKEEAIKKLKEQYPLTLIAFGKGIGFKVSYAPSTELPEIWRFWKVGGGLELSLGFTY